MQKAVFGKDDLHTDFFFPDNDRSMFDGIEYDQKVELAVKNTKGDLVSIPFCVTRNTFLGHFHRRIHGKVLGTTDGLYREIQIRLCKNAPEKDVIVVYLSAPPLEIK